MHFDLYQTCECELRVCRPSLVTRPDQPACTSRRETVWWTKSNFLGLLPKSGKDQWDCEISNYYVALPYSSKICHLHLSIRPFFERVVRKMFWTLLGYNVAKAWASPRNSTWFTRLFLLVRGWGLGTRLVLDPALNSSSVIVNGQNEQWVISVLHLGLPFCPYTQPLPRPIIKLGRHWYMHLLKLPSCMLAIYSVDLVSWPDQTSPQLYEALKYGCS